MPLLRILLKSTFRHAYPFFAAVLFLSISHAAKAETFLEALASAYESQPALLAQREQVKEIDETYIQARAAGRPTAVFNISAGRSLTELSNVTAKQTFNTVPRNGNFSVVQPLYQGGRVKGLKGQAKQSILAARQDLRNVEQDILLSAANAYINVTRDEAAAQIRRNNVRVLDIQRQAAQQRFEGGVGTKTEIAQAQSRLISAKRGLANAEADFAVSRQAYIRITGHPPETLEPPILYELPESLAFAQSIARSNNPQLHAAIFEAKAAGSGIVIAKSGHKPTLTLNGQISNIDDQPRGLGDTKAAEVTLQVRVPVYSGGLNKSRVRAARSAKSRLEFQARDVEHAVTQAVADSWSRVRAARAALSSSQAQARETKIAFQGVELERNAGLRNTLDVLDAEQEVLLAELAILDDRRALHQSVYQLMSSMGVFDAASLRLDVQHYDPRQNLDILASQKMIRFIPKPIEKIGRQLPEIPLDVGGLAVQALTSDKMIEALPEPAEKLIRQLPNIPRDIETKIEDAAQSSFIDDYIIDPPKKIIQQVPDLLSDVAKVPQGIGTELRDAIISQLPENQRIVEPLPSDETPETAQIPVAGYPAWREFNGKTENSISELDNHLDIEPVIIDPSGLRGESREQVIGGLIVTQEEIQPTEKPSRKKRKRNRSRSR